MCVNLLLFVRARSREREMNFTISKSQSALTEREKESIDDDIGEGEYKKESASANATVGGGGISSQLHLKSSSDQSLDKHVVLRRIKQRKSYNKAKSAIQALLAGGTSANTAPEQKWLQHGDVFSAP